MNLELRDVTEADLPILFEHQADPEANRMAAFSARDRDAFTAHWCGKILGNPAVGAKAIVVDDRVAGYVASWTQDGVRLLGYWIGRTFWGRGIASLAVATYVEQEPARPLCAWVFAENLSSIRVLAKCGFERVSTSAHEGVLEHCYRLDR